MIRSIIFDFGDVFINLDKNGALQNALNLFEFDSLPKDLIEINMLYEIGKVSTKDFVGFYRDKFPQYSNKEIVEAWNYILKDFPKHRLDFLKHLRDQNKYKLFLLSNTNEMHIEYVQKNVSFFGEFKSCFDGFYLSHEIGIRKPDQHIYDYVLKQNDLNPHECLFIDDTTENIEAAKVLGIHTWNIDETQEDVVDLFSIKSLLF